MLHYTGQQNNLPQGHFRYERKFFTTYLQKGEIEAVVRLHPEAFSEIYHERRVNNIYMDSLSMDNYFDNIAGAEKRMKVRVRWYGSMSGPIESPVLELKIKEGPMCNKISFPLKAFNLDRDFSSSLLQGVFRASELPDKLLVDLMCLKFSLLNSYSRKYFLSSDKKYRLTLDSRLEFYEMEPFGNTFINKSEDHMSSIVEIKYNREDNGGAHRITSIFPFRMTRSSKYVMGLERLNLTKAYSHV